LGIINVKNNFLKIKKILTCILIKKNYLKNNIKLPSNSVKLTLTISFWDKRFIWAKTKPTRETRSAQRTASKVMVSSLDRETEETRRRE
jgi:hypothetical protein